MTSKRLVPADVVAEAERTLAEAVRKAVDQQRATLRARSGPGALTAAAAAPGGTWDQRGWVKAVEQHVTPVATAVANRIVAAAKASVPLALSAGAAVSSTALANHVVASVLDMGDRLEGMVEDTADALDSAAGWVGDWGGRLAGGLANWAASDLSEHVAGQSTGPVLNVWRAVGDDRTRPDHDEADGQTQAPGDLFTVGDDRLAFPGDPTGSPEQTESCRCWLETDYGGDDS